MYTEFYGLVERPFELTPDQRYVYLSAHHREALAHLKYGVEERKGFIQLTGEVGTGKTTMLDVLASELDASTAVAKLSYTTIDELDLLRVLANGFGIDVGASSKAVILDLLRERLAVWAEEGKNAVFVVDEAQNLSLPVLEEIRLLSNLRANGKLSLQIVLAGQPELRDKLESTDLRQLRQRIGIRYHLTPLSREETSEYIVHRMAVAGSLERVFQQDAVDAIYEHSRGVPRVINMVCDRALLVGYANNRRQVDERTVNEAIEGLEGAAGAPEEVVPSVQAKPAAVTPRVVVDNKQRRQGVRWAPAFAASLAIVAIAVGAVFYFEGREAPDMAPPEDAFASRVDATDTLAVASTEETVEPPAASSQPGPAAEDRGRATAEEQESPAEWEHEGAPADGPAVSGQEPTEGTAAWEPTEAVADGDYVIVASSSMSLEAARARARQLSDDGMSASVWTVDLGERGTWHRVVLNASFETLPAARRAAEVVQRMGCPDAWVARK